MTEPNAPLLRKVLEWVEEQAELPRNLRHWDQHKWIVERSEQTDSHPCGTSYCFAGYAVAVSPEVTEVNVGELFSSCVLDGRQLSIERAAQDLLGLDSAQADRLFFQLNKVDDLRRIVGELTDGR